MEQRSRDADMRDVPTKSRREECVVGTEQSKPASKRAVPIMQSKEESALGMGQR